MAATTGQPMPAVETETAVPTLKVMRLQKPDLHMPTAGTLDTKCLLGTAMCLPDSFGVIHVGETFTAYLGALNVSKALHVTRLTVNAQLQTPSQRWHLASNLDDGNAAGGVDVPPEGGIDAIVSHALEEPGQHILRVEVGYGAGDGSIKTLRKFYRFQVSNPLIMSELTYRTGDACCFVSISLENNGVETKGALTICEAEFHPAPGISAERVTARQKETSQMNATELFDLCGRLEVGASVRYLFRISTGTHSSKLRGIAAGDELGKAVFTWRKACGEMGRMASSPVICPSVTPTLDPSNPAATMEGGPGNPFVVYIQGSGLSVDVAATAATRVSQPPKMDRNSLDKLLPVTVEPLDPPNDAELGVPFQVQFLVVNHSDQFMTIQLQFRMEHMKGLSVCGPSFRNLEEVSANGGSTTVTVRFVALAAGLLQVRGCCIVNVATGQMIPQPPLFNLLVEAKTTEAA